MTKKWIQIADGLLDEEGSHVSGKLIVHNHTFTMPVKSLITSSLDLDMLGYQKKKITMLKDYYIHKESMEVALSQLEHRVSKGTYGSCGVTMYAHFAKKERPTMGPCIQSAVFTHHTSGIIDVNVFYRTTEVFKKFAADLIFLRDHILPPFNPTGKITFFFANATYHPMYWVVSAPYRKDPVKSLEILKKKDLSIHKGVVRWTNRFLSMDPSLMKFKQGQRVAKHMHRLMDPAKLKQLNKYVREHV